MFWKEIDAFIPEPLAAAVEAAYGVFARYTLSGVIVHCDCPVCMTAETAQALSTRPLKEISPGLLAEYTNSAHGCDHGRIEHEFKHFLPRYLDLIAQCDPPSALDLAPCLDRLGHAGYRVRWPAAEAEAVDRFFAEYLKACVFQLGLVRWPAGLRLAFDLDEVLIMIARAGGDFDAALAAFDDSGDPEAAVHMASLRRNVAWQDGDPVYRDPFLEEYPEAAGKLGAFLVRDSVSTRILGAAALLDDADYDDVLDLGL